ncbi:hypothetical protein Shyhy01_73100 [Streptomyces hygroscopicus subsp. hygroscopicus]|nr:hypothetical protein [Streptomyces hygroscopicus]GLX54361.1 hypothetical protein Shyhy01_73100 [Streptomyces hygroscopicus subsp. hygroscopicus]
MTASAAVAYGPEGIHVDVVAPGSTPTETTRTREAGTPGIRHPAADHGRDPAGPAAPEEIAEPPGGSSATGPPS